MTRHTIARLFYLKLAFYCLEKLQNQQYDNFKVYIKPNKVAQEFYQCQSWRYPQQYKTISNSIKRLRYDYAIIKLKPNPKLEVKCNQFLPLCSPCPECLNTKKKQIKLLLAGYPFNCGKNYANLDVQAGKRIILNQYGQCGRDKIVSIDAGKRKISYTISTQAAQSGCSIISNNSVIGIHSGSQDKKQSNIGRLIDDQLIINVQQWAKELNCQGNISTTTFLPQYCEHISNARQQLLGENESDQSKFQQHVDSKLANLSQNISQNKLQRQDLQSERICIKEEYISEATTQVNQHKSIKIQQKQIPSTQSQKKPPNKKFVKCIDGLKKCQDSDEMIYLQNEDRSKWQDRDSINCYGIKLKISQNVNLQKKDVKDGQKLQEVLVQDHLAVQQRQQFNINKSSFISVNNSKIEMSIYSQHQASSFVQKRTFKGVYIMKSFQNIKHRQAIKRVSSTNNKYIAEHVYIQQIDSFVVKMGIDRSRWGNLLKQHTSLVRKLLHDVCNGILELIQLKIRHGDLYLRNIILYIEDQGPKTFDYCNIDASKIMNYFYRIRFRIIDFGDSQCFYDGYRGKCFERGIKDCKKSKIKQKEQLPTSGKQQMLNLSDMAIFKSEFDKECQEFLRQIWSYLSQDERQTPEFVEKEEGEDMTNYLKKVIKILKKYNH